MQALAQLLRLCRAVHLPMQKFLKRALQISLLDIDQAQVVSGVCEFRIYLNCILQFDNGRFVFVMIYVCKGFLVIVLFFLFRTGAGCHGKQQNEDCKHGSQLLVHFIPLGWGGVLKDEDDCISIS